jgi:hypothetical protein
VITATAVVTTSVVTTSVVTATVAAAAMVAAAMITATAVVSTSVVATAVVTATVATTAVASVTAVVFTLAVTLVMLVRLAFVLAVAAAIVSAVCAVPVVAAGAVRIDRTGQPDRRRRYCRAEFQVCERDVGLSPTVEATFPVRRTLIVENAGVLRRRGGKGNQNTQCACTEQRRAADLGSHDEFSIGIQPWIDLEKSRGRLAINRQLAHCG